MYTKTFNTPLFCPATYSSFTSSGGKSISKEGIVVTERLTRSGSNVPGYKNIIKGGGNATSNYDVDATRLNLSTTSGSTVMVSNAATASPLYDTHNFEGILLPIDVIQHNDKPSGDLNALALSAVYEKLRSERTFVNGLQFVGELKETIHMLKRPLAGIRDNLSRVIGIEKQKIDSLHRLKSSVRRRDAFAKMVSSTALEINFGMRPLFSDIKDIAVGIAKHQYRPPARDKISVSKSNNASRQTDIPLLGVGGNYGYQLAIKLMQRWDTVFSTSYSVGLRTDAAANQTAVGRLLDEFGFTAENILPVAYELTPWSWLLDYFTNVNDIIEAGTTSEANVTWVSRTDKIKTTILRQSVGVKPFMDPVDPNARRVVSFSGLVSKTDGVATTLARRKTSLAVPPLAFRNPFESGIKITNMLAVMEQQRKSVRF